MRGVMKVAIKKIKPYFPFANIRPQQEVALEFLHNNFIDNNKKFVILEAGTGVGKSAIGYTFAQFINAMYAGSAYFLTTQKILQQQYMADFGMPKGPMRSISSSSNYQCTFHKNQSCGESLRALRTAERGSPFWKNCMLNCCYKNEKENFLNSKVSVTNFPYFMAESQYAGKIKPRNFLVIDEAHNVAGELSKFIEITISERFSKSFIGKSLPTKGTPLQYITWIKNEYLPSLKQKLAHLEKMLEKYVGLKEKIRSGEFASISKKFDSLDKHVCKVNRFLKLYSPENWVLNEIPPEGKSGKKIEFKPIDVAPFSDEMLFNFGEKILLMSATILDKNAFCELLGIDKSQCSFLTLPTPFPIENRPIFYSGVGKMSASHINETLPKLVDAIKEILKQHKNEKGIIHCHSYRIASYIKKNIRSRRLLIHDSFNRDKILSKHCNSKTPTVLISPSMTEGVDLYDDLSRFQIICKVPYPYLGDKLIRKKMNKWNWWYPLQTAKTIVQAVGRSIRSDSDQAITYILDSDWDTFFKRNRSFFPDSFREAIL